MEPNSNSASATEHIALGSAEGSVGALSLLGPTYLAAQVSTAAYTTNLQDLLPESCDGKIPLVYSVAKRYRPLQGPENILVGATKRHQLTPHEALAECGRQVSDSSERAAATSALLPRAEERWPSVARHATHDHSWEDDIFKASAAAGLVAMTRRSIMKHLGPALTLHLLTHRSVQMQTHFTVSVGELELRDRGTEWVHSWVQLAGGWCQDRSEGVASQRSARLAAPSRQGC